LSYLRLVCVNRESPGCGPVDDDGPVCGGPVDVDGSVDVDGPIGNGGPVSGGLVGGDGPIAGGGPVDGGGGGGGGGGSNFFKAAICCSKFSFSALSAINSNVGSSISMLKKILLIIFSIKYKKNKLFLHFFCLTFHLFP